MGQGRAHTLTLRSHRAWSSGPQELGVEVVPEAPKIPLGPRSSREARVAGAPTPHKAAEWAFQQQDRRTTKPRCVSLKP